MLEKTETIPLGRLIRPPHAVIFTLKQEMKDAPISGSYTLEAGDPGTDPEMAPITCDYCVYSSDFTADEPPDVDLFNFSRPVSDEEYEELHDRITYLLLYKEERP